MLGRPVYPREDLEQALPNSYVILPRAVIGLQTRRSLISGLAAQYFDGKKVDIRVSKWGGFSGSRPSGPHVADIGYLFDIGVLK